MDYRGVIEEKRLMRKIEVKKWRLVLWACLIFLIGWLIVAVFFPDPNADDAAGYIMPGTMTRDFTGMDAWKYYVYFWENRYGNYAFVVRFSYVIILFSLTCILIFVVIMTGYVHKLRNEKRSFARLKNKYYEPMRDIMYRKKEMSIIEINNKLDLRNNKFSNLESRQLFQLILLIRYEGLNRIASKNHIRIAEAMGLMDWAENKLRTGSRRDKMRMLQTARLLWLPLPASLTVRTINDKDRRLRNMARMYYSLVDEYEPYLVVDKDFVNKDLHMWDAMETHQVFGEVKANGKTMPLLMPLVEIADIPFIKAACILGVASWSTDKEVEKTLSYVKEREPEVRRAVYVGVGFRKYENAANVLMERYNMEDDSMRAQIVRSIYQIHPEGGAKFLYDAYSATSSAETRIEVLFALMNYSTEGMMYYYNLKEREQQRGSSLNLQMFYHVENSIINKEMKKSYERIIL